MKKFLVVMMMLLAVGAYAIDNEELKSYVEEGDLVIYQVSKEDYFDARVFYNSLPVDSTKKGLTISEVYDIVKVGGIVTKRWRPRKDDLLFTNHYGRIAYPRVIKAESPYYEYNKNLIIGKCERK